MNLIYDPEDFDGILKAAASQDKVLADELRWQLQDGLNLGECQNCECGIDDDGLCYNCGQEMREEIERLHRDMEKFKREVAKEYPFKVTVEIELFLQRVQELTDYLPPRR